MEDLVEDVQTGIRDDGGERCHGIMVGRKFIGSTLPLLSLLSNITSVTSSAATLQVAEIIGGGGSGGGRGDGFIVRKECPYMPPANIEGKVAAHALSEVCQRRNEEFVGWELTVPRKGSSLWGNPEQMSAMDVMVWVGAVRR